jgi:hypothetical protein
MYKFVICLLIAMSSSPLSAECSKVPQAIRQSYTSNFYQAFVTQSYGKSTSAFCQFQLAYEEAKKAGESVLRLMVMEQLFGWYRMYGSASGLFIKTPEGRDRIIGEYQKPFGRHSSPPYHSEWGNTPEQAALVREFMLGIAETISGVFCVSATAGVGFYAGGGLFFDGLRRMYLTLSKIWADHERAMIDLKRWEETAQKAVDGD